MFALLERNVSSVATGLALCGVTIMLAFASGVVIDGLLRFIANSPVDVIRDIGGVTVAVAIACFIPISLIQGSHITITLIDGVVSPRAVLILNVLAALLVAAILIAVAYQFFGYATRVARAREVTLLVQIPIAPFWFSVAALLSFAAITQLIVVVRTVIAGPSGALQALPSEEPMI